MLFDLVDQTCRRIERLDVDRDWRPMLGELEKARPDIVSAARGIPVMGEAIVENHARALVTIATQTAIMARRIAADLRDSRKEAGTQMARATILAYFVQPNDLVRDDAPGGYGFLDDAVLLRIGASEALADMFPDDDQERVVWLLGNSLPEAAIRTLGEIMTSLQQTIKAIGAMNAALLPGMVHQLIANPLAVPAPAPTFASQAPRFSMDRIRASASDVVSDAVYHDLAKDGVFVRPMR